MKFFLALTVLAGALLAACDSGVPTTGEPAGSKAHRSSTTPAAKERESLNDAQRRAAADYFAGEKCYGDRIDECLGLNPEVEAMAQDASTCSGLDIRVCLVPIGFVEADIVRAIVDFQKRTANIDVVVLPGIAVPPTLVDRGTSQLVAKDVYDLARAKYPGMEAMRSSFIAVSPIDMRSNEYGWLFGVRYGSSAFGHAHGVFSYFRMLHVEPYDGSRIDDELVHERVAKYAARYTALLHLKYPPGDDIEYLDYSDMYGFSDLDSLGANWPRDPAPCVGLRPIICVVPDGYYANPAFSGDIELAARKIAAETGLPVEFRDTTVVGTVRYIPTTADWGSEYASDLTAVIRAASSNGNLAIVGVTDDNLSRDASVAPAVDRWFGDVQMSVVSGFGAGTPGTAAHQDRIYRLLLRGVLVAYFGMELNDDPASLLFRGVTTTAELEGKTIPAIPKAR